MPKSIKALINSEILYWARNLMNLEIEVVAKRANITPEKIRDWEQGSSVPSISQLRKLASVYRFPIAVFYLSETPTINLPRPPDRRSIAGFQPGELTPEIIFEMRRATERREITIELLQNLKSTVKPFIARSSLQDTHEDVANNIREMLGITYEEQCNWNQPRVAFNSWREGLEKLDILVFQTSEISLVELRGYSLFFDELPIIGVNRKDSFTARCFTAFHELAHILLRSGSICDLIDDDPYLSPEDKRFEVFCNAVAGATLVPEKNFRKEALIRRACQSTKESDNAIELLARKYSVSKEVIARRLLVLGYVGEAFYRSKRDLYKKEYLLIPKAKQGFISPVNNLISLSGRRFTGLVLENLNRNIINTSDFSDYLGIKLKHLDKLQHSFL